MPPDFTLEHRFWMKVDKSGDFLGTQADNVKDMMTKGRHWRVSCDHSN
jgi:hypothetical protein